MTSKAMSPNHREILSARSTITGLQEYLTSTAGVLNINGSIGGSPLPIMGAITGVGVAILDASGNQISSFGGGTQYAELNTTAPATGTVALARYKLSAPTLTDGQLYATQLDASGNLKVNIAAGSSSGQQYADGAARGTATGTLGMIDDGTNIQSMHGDTAGNAYVISASATASAVPANAFYVGISDGTNLVGPLALNDNSNGVAASATVNKLAVIARNTLWFNSNATWERLRQAENATNSVGTGIQAVGALAQFDDTSPTAITENSFGNLRISANRNLYSTIRDAAGNERGANVNASNQLSVSIDNNPVLGAGSAVIGKVSIDQTTPGTTNLVALAANQTVNVAQINGVTPLMGNGVTGTGSQRVTIASDNTAVSGFGVGATSAAVPTNANYIAVMDGSGNLQGQKGIGNGLNTSGGGNAAVGVLAQFDDVSPTAITENNFGNLRMSSNRNAYTTIRDAAGNERGVNVNASNQLSVSVDNQTPGTGATNLGKAEDAAAASGDTGVMALGVRNDSLAAAQTNTNGDYGAVSIDTSGILMTAGAPRALKGRQATTITSSTAETTIVTAVGSTFLDVYGLILTNTSATVTKVSVRDATAGGTISVFEVPATDTRGFMLPLDSAVPQAAVNNNWTAQCGTSVASLEVTVLYVRRV